MSPTTTKESPRSRRLAPPAVLSLWEDVAQKLAASAKVAPKKAAEALEKASGYRDTSSAARRFVHDHLATLVDAILAQEGAGRMTKVKAETCLRIALAEAGRGAEAAILGRAATVRTIAAIFDKGQRYYADNQKVRVDHIKTFHESEGFHRLEEYFTATPSTSIDACLSHFPSLLGAMFEAILVTRGEAVDALNNITQSVMSHILDLDDARLSRVPTVQLQQICVDLRRIGRMLTFQKQQDLLDFHAFWRALALKLVRSESAEHKHYGLDQVRALIEAAHVPRSYIISGASCARVNGTYTVSPASLVDGCVSERRAIRYECVVPDEAPGVAAPLGTPGKRFFLHLCLMAEMDAAYGESWWYISEEGPPPESDYYFHRTTRADPTRPPLSGWIACGGVEGATPPTLLPQADLFPIGDRHNTLDRQLSKWIIDEKVFDLVLRAHDNALATPAAVVKYLERVKGKGGIGGTADHLTLNLVLGQKTRLLTAILPILAEPSPERRQPPPTAATAAPSSSVPSNDFFTARGAARQRLASAERWKRSAETALREYEAAAHEVHQARAFIAELERSRGIIDVEDSDAGESDGAGTEGGGSRKAASKRRRT